MKILTGKVVSSASPKTLVVEVAKSRLHPLYKKIIRKTKRYKVHHEGASVSVGDIVKIVPTKPISKEKHYKTL